MPLPVIESYNKQETSNIKTIIAIAAGKGGVGKSTTAVNIALALHEKGHSVGILDADVYGPSIRKMLPEIKLPEQKGNYLQPALCFGLKVISMAFFRREGQPAAVRAPIANNIMSQFLNTVNWGNLDFLIIDFPPGTGDIQLTLAQQAKINAAIMVTTPQEVALLDVRKAMSLFYQMNVPILGIIENMSYYIPGPEMEKVFPFGQGGGKKLAEEASIPLLGEIPLDPHVSHRADKGFSLFIDDGHGMPPAAKAFNIIADNILKELKVIKQKPSQRRIQEFLQVDPYSFSIIWENGKRHNFVLSELQRLCPCAQCAEKKPAVEDKVCAQKVEGVGQYALRFDFTTGCSHGIYEFGMLYQLGEKSL